MSRQVGIWAGRPARVARDAVEDAPNNHASTNGDGGHEGGAGARATEGLVQQVSILVMFISLNAD